MGKKVRTLFFHEALLPAVLVLAAVLKNGIRIHQAGQFRTGVNDAGICNDKIIRRIYDHRIVEYPEALVQHFLDAALQDGNAVVLAVIFLLQPLILRLHESPELLMLSMCYRVIHLLLTSFPHKENRLIRAVSNLSSKAHIYCKGTARQECGN